MERANNRKKAIYFTPAAGRRNSGPDYRQGQGWTQYAAQTSNVSRRINYASEQLNPVIIQLSSTKLQ
jgi:hypothetical protein